MDWNQLTGPKSTAGSIANWLNNSTLGSGTGSVGDTIQLEAMSWIFTELRHWMMLTAPTTGTFTVGDDYIPLPSDMIEPDVFMITGVNFAWLQQRTMQDVISSWNFDGNGNRISQQPRIYYFDQANFRFDSPADQAYAYALTYYQLPAALSATNLTNFLTTQYPRLVRIVCMMFGTEWAKDSGVGQFDRTYWEQMAGAEIERVQAASDRSKRGTIGGAVMIGGGPPDTFTPYGEVG